MRKATSLFLKLRLLLSCFLLLSFLSTSLQIPTHFDSHVSVLLSKKLKGGSQSDSESPFQESEKELEEKTKDAFVLYTLGDFIGGRENESGSAVPYWATVSTGTYWSIPLYISKRSLLI